MMTRGRCYICILLVFGWLFWGPPPGWPREIGKKLGKVTLALQWLTQCQFAGYYVALEKGWYREEGIDLTIQPGAPDLNPVYLVSSGAADFGTKWLADFLAGVDKNRHLVSLAQVFQSNGLVLLAKAKSGITRPRDLVGKRLGIWFFGNEVQFYALMRQLQIPLERLDIKPLKWSIEPFLQDEFQVITAMIYNEYLMVLDAGYRPQDLTIIDFADYGLNFPGDLLFTTTNTLKNRPDLCEKMVRASLKGWAYALNHPEEAVDIVLKHDKTGKLKRHHQLKQMREIIKLVRFGGRPLGWHDPEQVQRVVRILLDSKILSAPLRIEEVYTNRIWEKVRQPEGQP